MSCYSDYLNTLGELEGFIESQRCDHTVVVGDFNVDFDRGGSLASLLTDFIVEHDFVVCDLSYHESVKFTYERDDGLVNSLCVRSHSHCVLLMFILLFLELTCLIIYHFVLILTTPAPQSLCRHLLLTPDLNLTLFGLKPPLRP